MARLWVITLVALLCSALHGQSVADAARANGKTRHVAGKTFSNQDEVVPPVAPSGSQSQTIASLPNSPLVKPADAAEADAAFAYYFAHAREVTARVCGTEPATHKPANALGTKQVLAALEPLNKLLQAQTATLLMAVMFQKAHDNVLERASQSQQGTGNARDSRAGGHPTQDALTAEKIQPTVDWIKTMDSDVQALYDRCSISRPRSQP